MRREGARRRRPVILADRLEPVPTMIHLYGIPHCDSVKRARAWFAAHALEPIFHDYKREGVETVRLDEWMDALGWAALLNRQGTTWRKLDAAVQASVIDATSAGAVMRAHPSVIKRPVVVWSPTLVTVGFDADRFAAAAGLRAG